MIISAYALFCMCLCVWALLLELCSVIVVLSAWLVSLFAFPVFLIECFQGCAGSMCSVWFLLVVLGCCPVAVLLPAVLAPLSVSWAPLGWADCVASLVFGCHGLC